MMPSVDHLMDSIARAMQDVDAEMRRVPVVPPTLRERAERWADKHCYLTMFLCYVGTWLGIGLMLYCLVSLASA